jgi:hypothetical protein
MCYRRRLLLDRSLIPFSVDSEHPLDNCHSPLTRAPRRRPAKRANAGEMPGRLKGHFLEYYRTFLTALHQGVVRATVLGTTLAPVNGLTPDAIVEESCQVVHSSYLVANGGACEEFSIQIYIHSQVSLMILKIFGFVSLNKNSSFLQGVCGIIFQSRGMYATNVTPSGGYPA